MAVGLVKEVILAIAGRRQGAILIVEDEARFYLPGDFAIFGFADFQAAAVIGISLWIFQVIDVDKYVIAAPNCA